MSFLDEIVSLGSKAVGVVTGEGAISTLARTAIAGFALNQLMQSMNNDQKVTRNRTQVTVDPDNHIPVVYGTAYVGGIITDARLTNDNGTMYYCLTLCERTGNLNLGEGDPSVFTFGDIYRDDMRLIFENDGITVKSIVDREGSVCSKPAGKIKVYLYGGNSLLPKVPDVYTNNLLLNAYTVMPGWTSSYMMSNLIFAIIRIDYDAKNNLTSLGNWKFQVKNTMTQPGDCLYDYMTNTTYGAGIQPGDIYKS